MVRKALNISYAYSATQNNGKITSETDALSMEQVLYIYDSLNRLASAQTAGAGGWGQSYTYDGFGNLTDQTLIKGTAPDVHVAYNYLTNRQTGDTADANGNIGSTNVYDIDNRLVQPSSGAAGLYAYDPSNKRVWRWNASGLDELTFWAGQKLATYQISVDGGGVWFTLTSTNVNFGGKLVSKGTYNSSGTGDKVSLTPVVADRLGSIGKFYPYGVERPSATQNDKEKFTGYFRDASTGLDYADQRYEQPGVGRFMSPDSAGKPRLSNPGSWNRYAYAGGDPINNADPTGQDYFSVSVSSWYYGGDYYDPWTSYYLSYAYAAINQFLMPFETRYNDEVSQLSGLQNDGVIDGYSVDFWSGTAALSFLNGNTIGWGLGICAAAPEACPAIVIGGGVLITIYVTATYLPKLIEAIQSSKITSRDKAPVSYSKEDVGRNSNGDCNDPDPNKFVKWKGSADYYHYIDWNVNEDCEAYPTYKTGPDPGSRWRTLFPR